MFSVELCHNRLVAGSIPAGLTFPYIHEFRKFLTANYPNDCDIFIRISGVGLPSGRIDGSIRVTLTTKKLASRYHPSNNT